MLNLEKIGLKIQTLRRESEMTQLDLSEALFVTHQAVSKWEKGKSIPSIDILFELTKLFNVSIDFLLDDSEILDDDYPSMFKYYARNVAINKFITSKSPNDNINKIFYLLDDSERKLIINMIVSNNLKIDLSSIWPYLTKNERKYILGVVLTNKYDYDLSNIYHNLTTEENMICNAHRSEYKYNYSGNNYIIKEIWFMERYYTFKNNISRPIISSFENCFDCNGDLYNDTYKNRKIRY